MPLIHIPPGSLPGPLSLSLSLPRPDPPRSPLVQFSRKLKEGTGDDPILPAESYFDPGLDAELRELGVDKSQSRTLCCELGRASKSALKTLRKQLRSVVNAPSGAAAAASGRSSSKRRVAAKRLDESTYVLQLGKNK